MSFRRIKAEQRDAVEQWLAELNGPRRDEALETLRNEGVRHESASIIDTSDGPILVYAMESDDIDQARAVGAASTLPVDRRHHDVMRTADGGAVSHRLVLDVSDH
ncbi:DUF6176 family protein [Agreia bicolorata]|nr:DUF6176 family protein [Agreia bicolorata]